MRLEKFLKLEKLSIPEFAEMIGVNKSAVFRYIHEGSIPKAPVMTKIYLVTRGAVSANDFYRLTDQIFDVELEKNILAREELHADSFR